MQARKHASEGIHPGFETQVRHHQKSKIGVPVAPRKGLMSSKNKNKKKEHKIVPFRKCNLESLFILGRGFTNYTCLDWTREVCLVDQTVYD